MRTPRERASELTSLRQVLEDLLADWRKEREMAANRALRCAGTKDAYECSGVNAAFDRCIREVTQALTMRHPPLKAGGARVDRVRIEDGVLYCDSRLCAGHVLPGLRHEAVELSEAVDAVDPQVADTGKPSTRAREALDA